MSATGWEALGGIATALFTFAGLYITYRVYLKPKRDEAADLQRRLFERLLGNDGSDGLPQEPSIFTLVKNLGSHLTDQDQKLDKLLEEFPVTRREIASVAADLKASKARSLHRWVTLTAELAAHDIVVHNLNLDEEHKTA